MTSTQVRGICHLVVLSSLLTRKHNKTTYPYYLTAGHLLHCQCGLPTAAHSVTKETDAKHEDKSRPTAAHSVTSETKPKQEEI
jgi:hypothetical protein